MATSSQLGQGILDVLSIIPAIGEGLGLNNPWDSEEKHKNPELVDYSQGISDYYIPGGHQFAEALSDPTYMGSYQGYMYDDEDWYRIGSKDKYQWLGKDIGKVDYKYNYDKLGMDEGILSQLRNLLSASGTGGKKSEGDQFAIWEGEDPTASGTSIEMGDSMVQGTGDFGSMNFLDYTNVFDRQNLADTLSMITGKEVDASSLPQIDPRDVLKTRSQFYTPMEIGARKSLLDNIMAKYREVGTGGFAGSGARRKKLGGVRGAYTQEMDKVYQDIGEARLSGVEKLSDKISRIYDRTRV